ncbi:MAG: hypothetical protein PVI11_00870 [Candidatus Aminicenantes bacterium]
MKGIRRFLSVFIASLAVCLSSGGEIQNIQFELDVSLKSSESGETLPSDVSWIEADSKGNMYILDRKNVRILKYDQEGKFISVIGKESQDPDRLETPTFLVVDRMDYLYVHDVVKKALVVFNEEGDFIRNIKYTDTDIFLLYKVIIDPQSTIVCGYCPRSAGKEGQEYRISRFDKNFEFISDIYVRRDVFLRKEVRRGSVVFSLQAPAFTPRVCWTMGPDGRFYVNYSNSYRIKIFSEQGTLEDEIRKDVTPEAINPAEQALMRAKYGGRVSEFIGMIPFPSLKPPVTGLYVVEGLLFVRKNRAGNLYLYDIYDTNNVYFGSMALDFVPFLNKNGCVYTFNMGGELDSGEAKLTELTRYKIHKE